MRCREDHHRCLVWVVVGNHLIHLEQVAIAGCDDILAQTVDCVGEVQVNGIACSYAVACVATLFGCTAGDVARTKVTECRIAALQVVVAVFFLDFCRFEFAGADCLGILFLLRNPDAAVVTQRL